MGAPNPGFVVVDSSNCIVLSVDFPARAHNYRTTEVPLSALDLDEIHRTAGMSFP
jgi:hypothetical protein